MLTHGQRKRTADSQGTRPLRSAACGTGKLFISTATESCEAPETDEHAPKQGGNPSAFIGAGTPCNLPCRPPLGSANDYKWQRTSNLIAKGNDAASIRLDSPQKAISSNDKKKTEELGVKMAGIDRKVSVLNTTAEGRKVVLTEVLRADKNEGEKTKLVSAENKLQINHPTIKSFRGGRGSGEKPLSASRTGCGLRAHPGLASSPAPPARQGSPAHGSPQHLGDLHSIRTALCPSRLWSLATQGHPREASRWGMGGRLQPTETRTPRPAPRRVPHRLPPELRPQALCDPPVSCSALKSG